MSVAPDVLREELSDDIRGNAHTVRAVEPEGLTPVHDVNEVRADGV